MKINALQQYKDDKGLTYEQLSKMTGLHRQLIYQHCKNQKGIGVQSALQYSRFLKIPLDKLLK